MGLLGFSSYSSMLSILMVAIVVLGLVLNGAKGGKTSTYFRKLESTEDMPLTSDVFHAPSGYNAPQQVHITQGDHVGTAMIVSWVTMKEAGSNTVLYWSAKDKIKKKAEGVVVTYKYYNYTSGYIHHCNVSNLEYDTKYYYVVGVGNNETQRKFWFTTPPAVGPDVPYTFGLIGDLGQTYDSNTTLSHYEENPRKGKTVLFVGDLTYADQYPNHDNNRWDSWGRFVERNNAYQPWIWTAGNHDLDFAPEIGENVPFKPFTHRYPVPFKASGSTEPLFYSITRASAHIIVLSSYSASGKYTPQYKWLEKELKKVDRSKTPWLIVMMHAPLYNSNNYHYMEAETMRVVYESWFVNYKVDVVFAGHVHAYERSERVSNIQYNITNGNCSPIKDQSAPVYITIGDGGNIEGLANKQKQSRATTCHVSRRVDWRSHTDAMQARRVNHIMLHVRRTKRMPRSTTFNPSLGLVKPCRHVSIYMLHAFYSCALPSISSNHIMPRVVDSVSIDSDWFPLPRVVL